MDSVSLDLGEKVPEVVQAVLDSIVVVLQFMLRKLPGDVFLHNVRQHLHEALLDLLFSGRSSHSGVRMPEKFFTESTEGVNAVRDW